jgi:hypothetical protein
MAIHRDVIPIGECKRSHRVGAQFYLIRKVALLLGLAFASGCVPIVSTYPKVEHDGAAHINAGCSGPASSTYYPFHGIYISIDVQAFRLGLHVPSGNVVQLDGKTIQTEGASGATLYDATFELCAAARKSIGTSVAPADWTVLADPYKGPESFGPLDGGGTGQFIVWYLYVARDPQDPKRLPALPRTLEQGTVELPAMTINGHRYESQKLPFGRAQFVGIVPVNC